MISYRRIERFFQVDLWQINPIELSPVRRIFYEIIKILFLAIKFFTTKRVLSQAAALTYSLLLAIVPIMAVVFAIARGFGYSIYIEVWFREALSTQPQVAEVIIGFVNSYLVHTKSGIFLGVGLIFMLYTVLMLVSNIEATFNEIWQVKKQRSIFRTFTDYLAMFFLFPILVVLSSGLSIFMVTIVSSLPDFLLLGSALRFLIRLAPYVLMSGLFMALYLFMPNTHVKVKNVIVPGILAGIAMQWLQFFYINSQIWMTSYNAIYGSFAALPMFMLWVQISWTICLFGAELCYTSQNLDYYDYDARTDDISHRYQIVLYAILMSRICNRYANGKKPYTLEELTKETGIPVRISNDLLYKLVDCNLLIEITSDEKGEASRFVPYESLDNLNLGMMVDRLEANGKWKIDLPVGQLLNVKWIEAMNMRTNYLKSLQNVRLEDICGTSSSR